jgi:hypothetical protein
LILSLSTSSSLFSIHVTILFPMYFAIITSRVARGNLTLTLSQNRTGASRLIRLLSSSRRCNAHLPVSKQGRFSHRDLP